MKSIFYVAFAACVAASTAISIEGSAYETANTLLKECGAKDISLCLKMRALTYVDRALRRADDLTVVDGISLVKTDPTEAYRGLNARALSEDELDASLPKNEDEKSSQVDNMLFDRIARFLQSHTLQLKVPTSAINEMKRSLEEGRDKKKKQAKKIIPALMMMIIFKVIASIPFILGTLALLAFKALLIGKIALVLSLILGLHKLLAHKHHSQTYEVAVHPHEEHGHYAAARNFDGQELAYKAHLPNKSE